MTRTFTAFADHRCVAHGVLEAVAAVAVARQADAPPIQIFDDETGHMVDLDLRGGADAAAAEFRARVAPSPSEAPAARRGRGRPRLGVVAREVTLLPRHWDWLATQPGGASSALRRLVEAARRTTDGPDRTRQAREAVYRVMSALAGDLPAFEEASRALFSGDAVRWKDLVAAWPSDVAGYLERLAATRRSESTEP